MAPLMIGVSGVRGIVGPELNPLVVSRWSAAFAELLSPGPIVLGRDSRVTGPTLASAASAIFASMGREVWDLGIVPTPTVQLAVERWQASGGLILSASHNPARWNALKFVGSDGSFLSQESFTRLRAVHGSGWITFCEAMCYGRSHDRHDEALELHREAVLSAVDAETIRAKALRVTLDTGHGAGGTLLPDLARDLGVVLDGRNISPDGHFAENPEPTTASLNQLLASVDPSQAFAAMVDPDADRFALALPGTGIVGEEWTLPLVARWRLERDRGPLVTNLSTSTRLEAVAERFEVPVYRAPVGEAHVVSEMKARGAILGGEGNGGVIDPAVHLGRDAAVAFARICEAEAAAPGGLRALAEGFPPRFMLKEKVSVSARGLEPTQSSLFEKLGPPDDLRDGLRWSRPDGFVHVRASGTEPILRLVVESSSAEESEEILARLRRVLK